MESFQDASTKTLSNTVLNKVTSTLMAKHFNEFKPFIGLYQNTTRNIQYFFRKIVPNFYPVKSSNPS